ncbi:hypothetical protein OH76DRAFT_512052 [Lentinus brumalis]|uniref:Uncharacterized protein n=1 Tax=Lentinus brumalis TaxID=2498619 RepID=A0A371DB61_9APHY|nr:hypothetical protein OH76DRAFT_512052 [Polyporus brumalis]
MFAHTIVIGYSPVASGVCAAGSTQDDTDVNIQGVNRPVRAKARGQRLGRRSVTCNWALDYEDDASSPFASLFSSTTNNADDPRTAARFSFCCLYAP